MFNFEPQVSRPFLDLPNTGNNSPWGKSEVSALPQDLMRLSFLCSLGSYKHLEKCSWKNPNIFETHIEIIFRGYHPEIPMDVNIVKVDAGFPFLYLKQIFYTNYLLTDQTYVPVIECRMKKKMLWPIWANFEPFIDHFRQYLASFTKCGHGCKTYTLCKWKH